MQCFYAQIHSKYHELTIKSFFCLS